MTAVLPSGASRSVLVIYAALALSLALLLGVVYLMGIRPLTDTIESMARARYAEEVRASAWGLNNIVDKHVALVRQFASRSAIRQRQIAYLKGDISLGALVQFSAPKLSDALVAPAGAPEPGGVRESVVLGIARHAPDGTPLYTVGADLSGVGRAPCVVQQQGVALLDVTRDADGAWAFVYCSTIRQQGYGRVGFDIVAISGAALTDFIAAYSSDAAVFAITGSDGDEILFDAGRTAHPDAMAALRQSMADRAKGPGAEGSSDSRFVIHDRATGVPGMTLHVIVDMHAVLAPVQKAHRNLLIALPVTVFLAVAVFALGLRPLLRRFEAGSRIAQSRENYRALFHGSHAVMLLLDPETGDILEANAAAARFYGYPPEVLRTLNNTDINTLAAEDLAFARQRSLAGDQNTFEFEHALRSGETRMVEVYSSPTTWEGRQALFSIIHDITARKRLEAYLIQARQAADAANKAKSEFVAAMSHELRTPLNAILGFSEIIRDNLMGRNDFEKYREYAGDIHSSGQHLIDLIDDLLDLSKIEAGRRDLVPEDLDIAAVLQGCARLVRQRAANHDLTLDIRLPEAPLTLHADPRALRQILFNLLSNAIKYTPAGGHIVIGGQSRPDGSVELSVSDTGIGLSENDQTRVFQPFARAARPEVMNVEGTGLGLALVKALADALGASVLVTSQPGRGSTFSVVFPPAPPQPSP